MWDAVKDKVWRGGEKRKVGRVSCSCCSSAVVSLHACLPLSSGQETPTVSAVSLKANEFPGGGGSNCAFMFV